MKYFRPKFPLDTTFLFIFSPDSLSGYYSDTCGHVKVWPQWQVLADFVFRCTILFLPLPHPPTPTPSPPTLPNTALKMPFCHFIDCFVRSNRSDHINAAQRHLSSSGSNRKPQLQGCQASVHVYTTSQIPESLTELHIYKIATCSDKFFSPYLFKALLSEKCYWEGCLEIRESNNLGGQADKFASSGYRSQIGWICFLSSWEIERC